MRAFDLIQTSAWAMTEQALTTLLLIANREGDGPQAVAAELGRPLDNAHSTTVRNGVAVIPVSGPIFRYANMFTEISGATSVETLAQDFSRALGDASVYSILLHIDSPGGEVSGINEFSNMLYAARGTKPIVAYIGDVGASAAYWIASAADEVVCDDTATVGSIGVIAAVPDPAAKSAKSITFISSQSPHKVADPTTETGRSRIQDHIDALASVFVATVARNRGVTPETVLADFGQGGVLVGQQAVDAGLADRLGSYEQVLSELSRVAQGRTHGGRMDPKAKMYSRAAAVADADVSDAPQRIAADHAPAIAAVQDELAQLRQQLAAAHAETSRAAAEAFVGALVHAGRLTPAEQSAVGSLYAQLAGDDREHPLPSGSRVAALTAICQSRPAHALLTEQVAGATFTVLGGEPAAADAEAKKEQRKRELLAATPAGKAALKKKG